MISTRLSSKAFLKPLQAHAFYKKTPHGRERSRNVVPNCKAVFALPAPPKMLTYQPEEV